MTAIFYIIIFLASCFALTFAAKWLINSLIFLAKSLDLKEFVVAFFIMSFASSAPNLFVGIISAANKIPELSLGDVTGGNLIDLTLVIALAVFFSKNGLEAESRTAQSTAIFTVVAAVLPVLLIEDGKLGRFDGVILILAFLAYSFWLFSKKERFTKVYDGIARPRLRVIFKHSAVILVGTVLLFFSAEGIIKSAEFFSKTLNFPVGIIGVLIVGVGTAMPETWFSLLSVRKGDTWLVLGNLMGSVVTTATLVLGIVALICPIEINNSSSYVLPRIFLTISAVYFLIAVRTGKKITKKEGFLLLGLYVAFLISEAIIR